MGARIPPDIADMLRQEERDLYKSAFDGQRDPAADIFRMAQLRGYRPPAPAPKAGNGAQPGAAPAAQARPGTPLGAPAAAPTATDIVASIQRGQQAAQSLSNVSGNAGIELTPQMLADMPEEQFAALYHELEARGKNALMDVMGH
jgi:hypothetical protein